MPSATFTEAPEAFALKVTEPPVPASKVCELVKLSCPVPPADTVMELPATVLPAVTVPVPVVESI